MSFKKGQLIQFSEDEKLVFGRIEQVLDNDSYIVSYLTLFKGRRVTILERRHESELSIVSNDTTDIPFIPEEYNNKSIFSTSEKVDFTPSLRDMVAMHALQGLLAGEEVKYFDTIQVVVSKCFEYADDF
jgi:hypothetical protein